MKRFTLNKKRASKVLALTLLAALVVPSVPAQKSVAANDGASVTLPDPIATVNFANASSYSMSDSVTGKQLSFPSSATSKAIWNLVTSDGTQTKITYESIDKAPQMVTGAADKYDPESYVWKDIDVAPTVVEVENEDVSGSAVLSSLSLKNSVDVADKYPAQASNEYSAIQSQKRYSSAVEVANPFAGNTDLYDASRYTMDKIYETATEKEVKEEDVDTGWTYWKKLGGRFTAPEAKAGVTISFWAQTPLGKEKLADTNFFEFYNTESLVYSPDDLGKAWAAYQIDNNKSADWGTDDPESPFYKGEVVTATAILVANDGNARDAFTMASPDHIAANKVTGQALAADYRWGTWVSGGAITVKYVKGAGELALLNPEARAAYTEAGAWYDIKESADGIQTGRILNEAWVSPLDGTEYQRLVNLSGGHWARVFYVDSKETTEDGTPLMVGVQRTTEFPLSGEIEDIEKSGWGASNYATFRVDSKSDTGYGTGVRAKKGGTGMLYMSQKETKFDRDAMVYDGGNQYTGTFMEKGVEKTGQLQAANTATVAYENEVADTEWHYYTVTLTDEWMQVYVDGVACDIASVENNPWASDKFNMGSGLYDPAGNDGKGAAYQNNNADARRLWSNKSDQRPAFADGGSIYGYIMGDSIMKFITDPNTKLYMGGKTRQTAEGTLIANVAFYDVKMTAEQAAAAYDAACDDAIKGFEVEPGPTPGPTGTLGNVNGDTNEDGEAIIDSKDALAVLKYALGLEPGTFDVTVANVNGDTNEDGEAIIDSKDALEILKYSLGLIQKFSGEE